MIVPWYRSSRLCLCPIQIWRSPLFFAFSWWSSGMLDSKDQFPPFVGLQLKEIWTLSDLIEFNRALWIVILNYRYEQEFEKPVFCPYTQYYSLFVLFLRNCCNKHWYSSWQMGLQDSNLTNSMCLHFYHIIEHLFAQYDNMSFEFIMGSSQDDSHWQEKWLENLSFRKQGGSLDWRSHTPVVWPLHIAIC